MAPRPACRQLEGDANGLGEKIIAKYQKLEKEFDRKTNHGKNDGPRFP